MNTQLWELYNNILQGHYANGTQMSGETLAKNALQEAREALTGWNSRVYPQRTV